MTNSTVSKNTIPPAPAYDRFLAESVDEDLVQRDAERESLRGLELAAARATIRELQVALATWAPLENAYQAEMARRAASRFRVEPREIWVHDIARKLNGVRVGDPGAVRDWEERGPQAWLDGEQ